jgi:hypothetical protein
MANSPGIYISPTYGVKGPQPVFVDTSTPLNDKGVKFVQQVTGTFLYYAIAQDPTFLTATTEIAAEAKNPTKATLQKIDRLLGYAMKYPCNETVYKQSDMILHFQSDGSYLSRRNSLSGAGGIFYLGCTDKPDDINGAVHINCKTIPVVTASAGETELAAVFMNCQSACPMRTTLEEMGYTQPATIGITDNEFTEGVANKTVKAKRSKSIDMRFHWVADRVAQKQFKIIWRPGIENIADFFTKIVPVKKHSEIMHKLVRVPPIPSTPSSSSSSSTGSQRSQQRRAKWRLQTNNPWTNFTST